MISAQDRARIEAAAESSAYEDEGDAERSHPHERGYLAGATAEIALYAPLHAEAVEAMEAAMQILEDIGYDCDSPEVCVHEATADDCVYSALKRSVAALREQPE